MDAFEILVIYKAKSKEAREQFVAELTKSGVLSAIRKEKGCLCYEYYYSAEDEARLVLYERWETKEHQKLHMSQPHMQKAMDIKSKYIESATLKKIELSSL